MGIPKLLRSLSVRYPNLCKEVTANQLPEYDHLYVDTNFLIHKAIDITIAAYGKNADKRLFDEAAIFEKILRWIETLYRLIQPSKSLFLAIDGVAPVAKWNTQRKRRMLKVEETSHLFDRNCISPGTAFMVKFETVLAEFVANKIKFDKMWQQSTIIINGSNCSGEGSIKIVEQIRRLKLSNQLNVLHCIYSGDTDFLMLGLATHELYVSLLQEVNQGKRHDIDALCRNDVKHVFNVVHFELLREYLELEFAPTFAEYESKMSFAFDMDKVADDWVLLCMTIGNDYLPGMPNFDVDMDILSIICDTYKEVIPKLGGYINESGHLDTHRFEKFIHALKLKDFGLYRNVVTLALKNRMAAVTLNEKPLSSDLVTTESESVPSIDFSDFLEAKDQYYTDHLSIELPNLKELTKFYIKALQWVLLYYYRGTYSWSFYYPYQCAPFVSDMESFADLSFSFEVDQPATPLVHLLALLPTRSKRLLPECYRPLVEDGVNGNLAQTTPEHQLPFVQKEKLEQLVAKVDASLLADENKRNRKKPMIRFAYSRGKGIPIVSEVYVEHELDRNRAIYPIRRSIDRDIFNFKFSTLKLQQYSAQLTETPTHKGKKRMTVKLTNNMTPNDDIDSIAKHYLNEFVYVKWPHCYEAKVIEVFDSTKKISANGNDIIDTPMKQDEFQSSVVYLKNRYDYQGVDIDEINVIVMVAPLKCIEYKPTAATAESVYRMTKNWDIENICPVAVQTLFKHTYQSDISDQLVQFKIGVDSNCFLFRNTSHYGEMVTVADTINLRRTGRIHVRGYRDKEPDLKSAKEVHVATSAPISDYKQQRTVANKLQINSKIVAQITADVLVVLEEKEYGCKPTKLNVGLQLKSRSKSTSIDEYVRCINKNWYYSDKAIALIEEYLQKFPHIFEALNDDNDGILYELDLQKRANNNAAYVKEVMKWLRGLPHFKVGQQPTGMKRLTDAAIQEVIKAVEDTYSEDTVMLQLKVKWQNLYVPHLNSIFTTPNPSATYKLLDRIVIVQCGYPVPVGAKGTIIAVRQLPHTFDEEITESNLDQIDILMDAPYTIRSELCKFEKRRIYTTSTTNMLINISHGRDN